MPGEILGLFFVDDPLIFEKIEGPSLIEGDSDCPIILVMKQAFSTFNLNNSSIIST